MPVCIDSPCSCYLEQQSRSHPDAAEWGENPIIDWEMEARESQCGGPGRLCSSRRFQRVLQRRDA
jgi:hypothetical protein